MEELIRTLIEPLVEHKEDIYIKCLDVDADGYLVYNVLVNKDDIGRIIGKRGNIAQAIRTICYAAATRNKQMVKINFDSYE